MCINVPRPAFTNHHPATMPKHPSPSLCSPWPEMCAARAGWQPQPVYVAIKLCQPTNQSLHHISTAPLDSVHARRRHVEHLAHATVFVLLYVCRVGVSVSATATGTWCILLFVSFVCVCWCVCVCRGICFVPGWARLARSRVLSSCGVGGGALHNANEFEM